VLTRQGGGSINYLLVPHQTRPGELQGIYVEFGRGDEEIQAIMTVYGYEDVIVQFKRGRKTFKMSLQRKKE
jgi:hypothetical protein